jgi:MFS-type transporter involved in bile tolerance (Atg22 family)
VLWELRVEHPLLDPRLFRLRGFGTGSAGLFIMFLAMFGFFLVAIQFLQLMLGYSPLKSAVALLPQALLMMAIATVAAPLSMRVGQRRLCTIGLFVGAIALGSMVALDENSSYWQFLVSMLAVSVAIGLAMTPATTAIVNSLPTAKQGVASAVNDAAREVGAAVGVAVLGSAFNIAYRNSISDHVGGLSPQVADGAREAPAIALQSAQGLGARGAELVTATQDAFFSGLRAAMVLGAALMAFAALYTWWRAPARGEALAAGEAEGDGEAVGVAVEPCWGSGAGAVLVRRNLTTTTSAN